VILSSADLQSPSCVHGASTHARCFIPVCVDSVETLLRLLLNDHKEETIVIKYFLYTDARLCWIAALTLLPLLSTSSGNDDV
jgi:hypothetical protein